MTQKNSLLKNLNRIKDRSKRHGLPTFAVALSLFFIYLLPASPGHYWDHNVITLLILGIFGTYVLSRRCTWVYSSLFLGLIVHTCYFYTRYDSAFKGHGPLAERILSSTHGESMITAILIVFLAPFLKPRYLLTFGWLCFFNSAFMIYNYFFSPYFHVEKNMYVSAAYGLLNASSVDATFIAMSFPLALSLKRKWYWYLLPVVAVILSQSNTGIFGLAIPVLYYAVKRFPIYMLIPTVMAGLIFVRTWLGETFLDSSGRWGNWQLVGRWWLDNAEYLYGMGLGSFYNLAPMVQNQHDPSVTRLMIWAHSDWFQVVFETGVFGLILVLVTYALALHRARHRTSHFLTLIIIGASALIQMPLRYNLTAVFIALLVSRYHHRPVYRLGAPVSYY